MSKINAIRINEKLIQLIPINAEKYGPLFEIDSVSLLLGTNGSGKTTMLVSIANAVGNVQDDSFQFYFQDTPNGKYEPAGPHNETLCSIYYSALPYRRALTRKKGVINASPNRRNLDKNNRLEEFGIISNILEIQTELIGIIRFTKRVFRTILIPILKESVIISYPLRELITEIQNLSSEMESNSNNYLAIDEKREKVLNRIQHYLEDVIRNKYGFDDGFYYLSSLEYILHKVKKDYSYIIARNLLEEIEVISYQSPPQSYFAFEELTRIMENTRKVIHQYCSIADYDAKKRTLKFTINDMEITKKIQNSDTAIQVEWSNQSSGLQALVEQFSLIDDAICKAVQQKYKSILLLIDEGDAYLHLDWQRKYISILNKYLGELKNKHQLHNLQLIMATHSPLLAADIPGDFVTSLDSDTVSNTFAAPIEEVIANAFSSNSLGEFAAQNINKVYKRALSRETTDYDRYLVESIGDIAIKATLQKVFNNDH